MIELRALGALLTYPARELVAALPEIGGVIRDSRLIARPAKERLAALAAELAAGDPYEIEERYVGLFDRGRATSLNLFEHVHGDSRERGQALVDLGMIYARAGLDLAPGELPDYLPALLEYLSCRSREEAGAMLGDCAHVLRAVGERLAGRGSRYAAVFDAILAVAGEAGLDWSKAPAPVEPEPPVDEDWMDAPAFGPGSERGIKPRAAAPVPRHMHKRN
ncbi:MAG: nitrate reductase molybdenum cofactor assembly chaperone [Burkholderiales bacterium]|nr:nitrate reductase molybdenum cofactor assembly chaperone [Burkholderiales bacterium]